MAKCFCGLALKVPYEYSQKFYLSPSSTVVLSTLRTLLIIEFYTQNGGKKSVKPDHGSFHSALGNLDKVLLYLTILHTKVCRYDYNVI